MCDSRLPPLPPLASVSQSPVLRVGGAELMMLAFLWGRSSMQHLRQSPPLQKALGKEGGLGGAEGLPPQQVYKAKLGASKHFLLCKR